MHPSVWIQFVLSGVLVAILGTQADGHLCPWKRANNCPYVVMAGGCGTRGVTGGYTIAQCKSTLVGYGCHRKVRVCSLPSYTCATPWAFICGGGGYDCGGYCGGDCGGSCGDGCGGCSGDGAMSYDGETYTGESNEEVISDGPAPAEGETGSIDTHEARNRRGGRFHLASNSRQDGSAAFDKGLVSFRARSLADALQSFEAAATAEPNNALYQYYKALTLFDLHGAEVAGEALTQAVELERRESLANWGKRMERVQGRGRLWVEKARREAGLVR